MSDKNCLKNLTDPLVCLKKYCETESIFKRVEITVQIKKTTRV